MSDSESSEGVFMGLSITMIVLLAIVIVAILCATVFKEQCKAAWESVSGLWSKKSYVALNDEEE